MMRFDRFAGSHGAMGRQRGHAHGELLRSCASGFSTWSRETRERSDSLIPVFATALEQAAPELIDEMHGVAEGCGLSYEDVLRLNFAEELGATTGCSQLGVMDAEEGAVLAKSEDAGFSRTYVVTELRPETGYGQLHVSAVSWVVGSGGGINEAGLAIGQSSVSITDQADGVPRLTLLRLALERCATVAQATAFMQQHTTALKGMNFLMVDATGAMAVVERSPSQSAVRWAEQGSVCCTNHYLTPAMRVVERGCVGSEPDLENRLAFEANTRQRYGRLGDFARRHAGQRGLRDALTDLLCSHGPGGICQHGIMHTTLSTVMVARSRELWVTDGPPCRSQFLMHALAPQADPVALRAN